MRKKENNTHNTLEIGVMHLLRFTNNIFKLKIADLFHQLLKLLTHDHFFLHNKIYSHRNRHSCIGMVYIKFMVEDSLHETDNLRVFRLLLICERKFYFFKIYG